MSVLHVLDVFEVTFAGVVAIRAPIVAEAAEGVPEPIPLLQNSIWLVEVWDPYVRSDGRTLLHLLLDFWWQELYR